MQGAQVGSGALKRETGLGQGETRRLEGVERSDAVGSCG